MILIDSHCHLDMLEMNESLDAIIDRANQAGVRYLQTISTNTKNIPRIIKIAEKYTNVFASVGIHPSEVAKSFIGQSCETDNVNENNVIEGSVGKNYLNNDSNENNLSLDITNDKIGLTNLQNDNIASDDLINLASYPKVIGIGETGLDYYYNDRSTSKIQIKSFEQHIITSQISLLPLIIHTRSADDDTADIIKYHTKHNPFPALIHCFTASKDFAKKMLDNGLYISISGIVTFKNSQDLQDILKFIPLDRLLIETDSPYLAPVPKRGKTNEPSFVRYVAEFIASYLGITFEQVANQTTNNFFTLFQKADNIVKSRSLTS